MPLYEYYCNDCRRTFEALRSMREADEAIVCEHCQSRRTARVLSVVFVSSGGKASEFGGGGGCGCGGHCACGHSHH